MSPTNLATPIKGIQLNQPVVLVGMMGSGKTTIGRRLAAKLDLPFVDADAEIERAAGLPIAEIFARYGEEHFRDGERRVIERLLNGGPSVLATGGGAFIHPDTRSTILENATAVWLDVSVSTLVERTSRRNTRPLLLTGDPAKTLAQLLEQRREYYAMAPIHIKSGSASHTRAVEMIIQALSDFQLKDFRQ